MERGGDSFLDAHGQPTNEALNWRRNQEKALRALLGFLEGLSADGVLSPDEVTFLDSWLREQRHLRRDPDVIDLLEATEDALEDGVLTEEEKDDLRELAACILEYRLPGVDPRQGDETDPSVQRLLGLVSGMMADAELSDAEIRYLSEWLDTAAHIWDAWPASMVRQRVEAVLADGVVTEDERDSLAMVLAALSGGAPQETGSLTGTATRSPIQTETVVEVPGRSFCLTGRFATGTRKQCSDLVEAAGGLVVPRVRKSLDYLVVGTLSSRDWAHTSHGRKIEQAVTWREKGRSVTIVAEEIWVEAVR